MRKVCSRTVTDHPAWRGRGPCLTGCRECSRLREPFSGGDGMEPGRQRLSQRRKAAALTQGLHGEGLGAELFTASQTGATPTPAPRPSPPAIPARSGRSKRFPVAGVLAVVLAASAASEFFVPSPSRPVAPSTAETPALTAPVAVIPASDPGSSSGNGPDTEGTSRAVQPPPAGASTASSGTAASAATTGSSGTTATKTHNSQSNLPAPARRKPAAPAVTAPSDTRPTPAEAYDALSRAAGLSAGDQRWTRHRPETRR